MLDGRGHVVEHDGDLVAQQVGDGRGAALVGHVHHVQARHGAEQLARQVDGAAAARGAVVQLAGVGTRIGDHFLDGLERLAGVGYQQVGHVGHARQGREVLDGVEAGLGVERGIDGMRAHGAHEQRVAVGRRTCGGHGADVAARAGLVVHDHGLAQLLLQRLGDDARQDVGGAASGEGHEDGDGLAGEAVLGQGGGAGQGAEGGQGCGGQRLQATAAGEVGGLIGHREVS